MDRDTPLIVEGEPTTLGAFLDANAGGFGFPPADRERIEALEPGESVTLGGGAFATYTVRRPRAEGER